MLRYSWFLVIFCRWLTVIRGDNATSEATLIRILPLQPGEFYPGSRPSYVEGGYGINISEASFMALLRPKSCDWHCGASIIGRTFLITAAHCVNNRNAAQFKVTVGTDGALEGGEDYEIEKFFVHPNFTEQTFSHDIALVKLRKRLVYNYSSVFPIEMASSSPNEGDVLDTMGFGLTEKTEPSEKLLKVKVPFVNRTKCAEILKRTIIEQMICAGGEPGKDACEGDSGGPLVYNKKLIGVTSWGRECGKFRGPGVYAYLPSMRDFIDDVLKNNPEQKRIKYFRHY